MTFSRLASPRKIPRLKILTGKLLASAGMIATISALTSIPADAVPPPLKISGASPFATCTADNVASQPGTNYPDSEIEPMIAVNPANLRNLIAGWQQDRWSNGGARGLVAGVSSDGGRTWKSVVPRRVSKCMGGIYDRASDPWVTISPNGTAFFMSLAFNNDRPDGGGGKNAVTVNRSINGGMTWSNAVSLIVDTDGRIFNDKNSMTADPTDSRYVYGVWDRLTDFTLPPRKPSGRLDNEQMRDGVVQARERRRMLMERAARGEAAPKVTFKGPTMFVRTTNGGASWEPAKVIYDPGNDAQTINNLVEVFPNGTVANFFTNISAAGATSIGIQKSINKGMTFARARLPISTNVTATGTLTPDDQAPVRDGNILFDVAIDPQNGNAYLVWQDGGGTGAFGGIDKVVFSMSTNGGTTWSTPIRISMTPASTNKLRNQSFVPSVEVGPNNQIVVTYYDFRFDQSDGKEATDYFAVFCKPATTDCAQRASWGDGVNRLRDLRLTRRSFNMLNAPIARGHFLGDYMGLARRGSVVMPAFGIADSLNKTSIYTLPIVPLGGFGPVAISGTSD